jgi:hypothetical protein
MCGRGWTPSSVDGSASIEQETQKERTAEQKVRKETKGVTSNCCPSLTFLPSVRFFLVDLLSVFRLLTLHDRRTLRRRHDGKAVGLVNAALFAMKSQLPEDQYLPT